MLMFNTKKYPKIKKRIPLSKIVIRVVLLLLGAGIFSLGFTAYENIRVAQAIETFKQRAIFESEVEFQSSPGIWQTRRYYYVPRETSYERVDTRSVFNTNRRFLGQKGDIFVTQDSPFPHIFGIHQFISFYYGGHAAIHDGENRFIEAVGFPNDDESLLEIMFVRGDKPHNFSTTVELNPTNYWLRKGYTKATSPRYPYFGEYYRNRFVGLRVKYASDEMIDGVVDYATDKHENEAIYNFLFFVNMRYKYYCTDLISRAYQDVMVEESRQRSYARALNDDRFITTVNDLILAKDTYLTFYVEIIDEIVHIYYLEDL